MLRLAANISFIDERWADAVAQFRYVASSDPERVQAGYGQLMFWLAQARAGVPKPEYVTRAPGDGWPQPLLLYMVGEYTEQELVARVSEGDDDSNTQCSGDIASFGLSRCSRCQRRWNAVVARFARSFALAFGSRAVSDTGQRASSRPERNRQSAAQ
jgi:hypothetical protein